MIQVGVLSAYMWRVTHPTRHSRSANQNQSTSWQSDAEIKGLFLHDCDDYGMLASPQGDWRCSTIELVSHDFWYFPFCRSTPEADGRAFGWTMTRVVPYLHGETPTRQCCVAGLISFWNGPVILSGAIVVIHFGRFAVGRVTLEGVESIYSP